MIANPSIKFSKKSSTVSSRTPCSKLTHFFSQIVSDSQPPAPRIPPREESTLLRKENGILATTSDNTTIDKVFSDNIIADRLVSDSTTETDGCSNVSDDVLHNTQLFAAPCCSDVPTNSTLYDLMEDSNILSPPAHSDVVPPPPPSWDEDVNSLCSDDEDTELPPYPEICFTSNDGFTLVLHEIQAH